MLTLLLALCCDVTLKGHVSEILVGDRSMPSSVIDRKLKAFGTAKRDHRSGMYRLSPASNGVESKLRSAGFDYVLPGTSDRVQIDSEPSVRNHVAYLEAKFEIARSKGPKRARRENEPEEEKGGDFYEALAWYLRNRVGPDGKLDRQAIQDGAAHRDGMPAAQWETGVHSYSPGAVFTAVGPKNTSTPYQQYMSAGPISGRKNAAAFAPSNPSIIYVASAGGGVWKSTNGGTSFSPLSDKWPFLNTSSITVHPTNPNIVLVGTGDYWGFFSKNAFGVMRTTDGGATWTNVGDTGMRAATISHIMFEPSNPNIVVATCGKSGSDDSGIHRSTDGGVTWTQTNAPLGNWDDLDRSTGGVYYAAGTYPNITGVVYKSTDQGATWTAATNPAVNVQESLEIACSKTSANTIYLLAPKDEKIYKSTTSAASWTEITGNFPHGTADPGQERYNWSQGTYDYHISCGKDGSTDLVFVGLITVAMNRGGGTVWTDVGRSFQTAAPNNIHSDQHGFAMHPTTTNVALFCCDGGLWKFTVTPGQTTGTWQALNSSFMDLQHYELAVSSSGDGWIQGGCQDNFTPSCRNNYSSWVGIGAGDGAWAGYGPNGQNFVTNQNGGIFLFTSLTDPTGDYIKPQNQQYQAGFFAPCVYAENPGKIYAGANTLWRYNNNNTWTNFGTDITPYQPQQGEPVNVVNELERAKNNPAVVYSGSSNGEVFKITNNGTTYRQIDTASIDRPVGAIDTAWTNSNDILVGLMGDKNGNPRLWRCSDTAATTPVWTAVAGSGVTALPDVPINSIERDPYDANRWWVATDVGCFQTTNAGVSWASMSSLGLPNVQTDAIVVNPAKTTLFVGTFGRGTWKAALASANNFTVSGQVKTSGGAGVSGATMRLYRKQTATIAYNTTPNLTIPDADANGVLLQTNVSQNVTITNVNVYLNITHFSPADLEIYLIHPSQVSTTLWKILFANPNIIKNFPTQYFNGLKTGGTWVLWVRDLVFGLEGTINTYNLSFSYEGYLTHGSAVNTNATGNYSFTGLPAGMYQLTPSQSGKTFSPTTKYFNLGPNQVVNFTRTN